MSDNQVTITLEADAGGALQVIKQVTRDVDQLAGKKVGNAGMPQLQNATQNAGNELKNTKSAADSLGQALGKVKNMIAGYFAVSSVVNFGKSVLKASADLEVFKQGLSFTLGSSAEAEKLIQNIQGIGEASAYDTTQLMPLARQWVNIGNTADEATSKMRKIVDLGSAFGMQTDQIQAANLALTQMSMAGKIGSQDMMQLINAGVPAWQLLADKMGLSVAQVRELSQQGELGEEAINTLWDAITEKTQGAAAKMGNTMMAKFYNMQESITNSMAAIGDIIIQGLDLKGFMDVVGGMTSGFKEHMQKISAAAKEVGVGQAIMDEITSISPQFAAIIGKLGKIAQDFGNLFISAWNEIRSNLDNLDVEGIMTSIGYAVDIIGPIAVTMGHLFVGAIGIILPVVVELLNRLTSFYNEVAPVMAKVANAIKDFIGGAIYWVVEKWKGLVEFVSHPINFVVNKTEKIRQEVEQTGSASTANPGFARGGVFGMASGGLVGGRIPALANGGQLKHGTPAIVGEAGPEAVIPLKDIVLGKIGEAMANAMSMSSKRNIPTFKARQSFSKATKSGDEDAYTKVLDQAKQKILEINAAQEQFHESWEKAQEEATKYTDGGEKTLAFQKEMASYQDKMAKLQEKINAGTGSERDAQELARLQKLSEVKRQHYEQDKAAALAAARETQENITQIDAEAEAARMRVKQEAIDKINAYETQVEQARYAEKKAMMARDLDEFLDIMMEKDEVTGQSYAETLAQEQYLAEQRRVWMDELMLASVTWGEYMQTMLTNMAVQVQDGIASGIAQCVVEGKKFSQVMSNLAKTLLKQLIQGVIQKVISGWIMAIGLGNNRHKQEMKNTAAETEAAGAKATVLASAATAAVIAANPAGAAGAAALVAGQMGKAAAAAGLITKAAQAVFKGKGDSDSGTDAQKWGNPDDMKWGNPDDVKWGKTKLFGMASGGVVTGPTAALIGEGRYDEAVLPLKPSLLEKLFGSGESRQTTVVTNQNIYGDINTREDDEDMFGGFNDLVLAGLRGA
ncbi:tape measure protein [Acidaminococcus intestini]|uniref:tape measure protein n=1 Tax=Acidaminococcus intestini TaxID=187327 RepID=UPI003AB80ABC